MHKYSAHARIPSALPIHKNGRAGVVVMVNAGGERACQGCDVAVGTPFERAFAPAERKCA